MSIQVGFRSFLNIDEAEKLLIHCATQYELEGYVEDFDGVEVTDPEYDELYKFVKNHKPNSLAFFGTSPSVAKTKGSTIIHNPPMTSIDKADGSQNEKELRYCNWITDCKNRLGLGAAETLELASSYKHDGVALRINYSKGKLISAVRPRDGVNGSDVTRHMKYIEGVPLQLPLPLTLSLNGEIECWIDDFKLINDSLDAEGEDPYKNPRNYAAGCMGRDSAEENKNAKLKICFYSITGFDEWQKYYKTEVERAKWANSPSGLNLQVKGKGYFVQVREHKFDQLSMMEQHAKKLLYYTDGVVLKVSDLSFQEELGHVGDNATNSPRGALAWKFLEETVEAQVSSIEWNASRTGRVVPTAIFDVPFVLADTENSRATCNNYGWMKIRGLAPAAKVICKKGGKIIPNIMEVIQPVANIGHPEHCPACSFKLEIFTSSGGNEDLQCWNKSCPAKHLKGWIHYIANMGGKGLGGSTMKKIMVSGKVKNLPDLYSLTVEDLTANNLLTERQAALAISTIWRIPPGKDKDNQFLVKQIEMARSKKITVDAPKFFKGLGIPQAGETVGKALVAHYKDFNAIRKATEAEMLQIAGIGPTTAKSVADWFSQNDDIVRQLLLYVDLDMPKKGKLTGRNFVLTGSFEKGKKHYESLISNEGGNIQSSVGSTTNYLIQEFGKNDGSPSEKEKKANKLGIAIISVVDLEKML